MRASRLMIGAAAWGAVTNLAVKGQALILSVVGAQTLELKQFGALMSWIGILYLVVVVSDFGLAGFLQREIASLGTESAHVIKHLVTVLSITAVPFMAVAACAMLLLHPEASIGWTATLLLAVWIELSLVNGVLGASLTGALRFRSATTAVSAGRTVSAVCLITLWLAFDSYATPAFISLSLLAGEATGLVAQVFSLPTQRWDLTLRGTSLTRRLSPYMLNNLANSSYARGDIPAVGVVAGDQAAGIYAPASQLQSLLLSITTILNSGTIAVVARLSAQDEDLIASRQLVRQALKITVGAAILASLLTAVTAGVWVPILFSGGFEDTVPIVQLIVVSVPIAAVHVVLSQALVALGKASLIASGTLMSVLGGLACLITFTSLWGVWGAALGVIARDVIFTGYCIVVWRRLSADTEEKQS